MIRVRRLSPEAYDAAYLKSFIDGQGFISVHQVPQMAEALCEDGSLSGFEFREGELLIGFAMVRIRHRILADISFGPVVLDPGHFLPCVTALKSVLRRRGLLILRIYPPLGAPACKGLPGQFNWATPVVDISRSEEELLKSFSPNHRQSIRKALAAGIRVRDLAEKEVPDYSAGHVRMFAKRGIARDAEATRRLVAGVQAIGQGSPADAFILSAYLPDSEVIIGGGIFLRSGNTCTYFQGYAERLDAPLPVLHLVLWEAMRRAKALGCSRFDLSGYSLDGEDAQLKAVNDFKRWFRGDIIHYPPTVVIPLYPLLGWVIRMSGKRI